MGGTEKGVAGVDRVNTSSTPTNHELFAEAFQPSLPDSFPLLNMNVLDGQIDDCKLVGPVVLEYNSELHNSLKVIMPVDNSWVNKTILQTGFDFVFPLTVIPLGKLREVGRNSLKTDRFLRNFITYPFFVTNAVKEINRLLKMINIADFIPGIGRIHVLMPHEKLWNTPFDDWNDGNWEKDCLSGLWDIEAATVKWLPGTHTAADITDHGVFFEKL